MKLMNENPSPIWHHDPFMRALLPRVLQLWALSSNCHTTKLLKSMYDILAWMVSSQFVASITDSEQFCYYAWQAAERACYDSRSLALVEAQAPVGRHLRPANDGCHLLHDQSRRGSCKDVQLNYAACDPPLYRILAQYHVHAVAAEQQYAMGTAICRRMSADYSPCACSKHRQERGELPTCKS